jgi:hypothetical protein
MSAFIVTRDQSLLVHEPSRVIVREITPGHVTLVVLQLDRQPRRRPQLDPMPYPTKTEIKAARRCERQQNAPHEETEP